MAKLPDLCALLRSPAMSMNECLSLAVGGLGAATADRTSSHLDLVVTRLPG